MVAKTRGYYARDWPLQLGWNNVRYIIEAGILHSQLLNRTLVIPSFVYARSCLFEMDVCSSYATRFHRGEEIGMGDFQYLPDEEQIAWRLPIQLMIDLPRLRQQHSVVTVAEYLRLHHLPTSLERANGAWDPVNYHLAPLRPTLLEIQADEWEPEGMVRVDRMLKNVPAVESGPIFEALRGQLNGKTIGIAHAQNTLRDQGLATWKDDAEFERILHANGWTFMHSFRGSFVEMFKAVTDWETEIGMVAQMRGLVDDVGGSDADVFHITGEIHWNRKAGTLRFTTSEARTNFASLVLNGVHPIPPVRTLGDRLARKMQRLNGGRQYMSAHMRRGDCKWAQHLRSRSRARALTSRTVAVLGWAEATVERHINRIMDRLKDGMRIVQDIFKSQEPRRTVAVPGITPDDFFEHVPAPIPEDKFFLATDAKNASDIEYVKSVGAVLITDLIDPEDRRIVGWPLLFGDVRAQVEQEVAARSIFFYGHTMSSVAGGVANLRGARGKDPRTCYVD
ncbi:hypothetical protein OF83DRAFT_1270888 [Amylostereum chailletii]|nr:hypothetical protein OF83DRAFT_1270888 [Amylostereum chailletii]